MMTTLRMDWYGGGCYMPCLHMAARAPSPTVHP